MKRIAKDLRKCSIHQLFFHSPISGNWYLRPHFAPRPPFLEMSFWSTEKTAEAMEMELVVCRCMQEWDYPSVMSALLNTITLYRSERDPKGYTACSYMCGNLCKLELYAYKWEGFFYIRPKIWSGECEPIQWESTLLLPGVQCSVLVPGLCQETNIGLGEHWNEVKSSSHSHVSLCWMEKDEV